MDLVASAHTHRPGSGACGRLKRGASPCRAVRGCSRVALAGIPACGCDRCYPAGVRVSVPVMVAA
jgi:hypothetical protein